MAKYYFKAKSFSGQTREDVAEAKDEHELAQKLHQEGWLLLSAKDQKKIGRVKHLSAFLSGITIKEKMLFAKNLGSMLEAGLPFTRALSVMSQQIGNKAFKKIIIDIERRARDGESFSQALGAYPTIFGDFFLSMVEVGENTGNLDKSLKLVAEQMHKDYEIRSKIRGAMIYPAVVVSLMILVAITMMVVFVPKLAATFKELKVPLPISTKIVVWFGDVFSQYLLAVIVGAIIIITALIIFFQKTAIGKKILDTIFLRLPGLKNITIKINCARFSRTMGALIGGGVAMVKSLEIGSRTLSNSYYHVSLANAKAAVQKGEQLSKSLGQYKNLYPAMVLQMLEVGEEGGALDKSFNDLAVFYEEEISDIIKNISSLIEPVIMILVGLGVGFFAVAMIQPLYGILKVI